jgi:DNA-binding beta-propeller fold protein YncE
VRKIDSAGVITTVAGNGDGPARNLIKLKSPCAVAADRAGNVFIADQDAHQILKVSPDGTVTTFAGTGISGRSADGIPATTARLNRPCAVTVDLEGNVLFAEDYQGASDVGQRIRKVNSKGIISTVAGTGAKGFSGDGGMAISARFLYVRGLAVDAAGNLFIADYGNNRIRKVDAATGIIRTIAGNGTRGFDGDGGPAVLAQLPSPSALAVDAKGDLFIVEDGTGLIRKVMFD